MPFTQQNDLREAFAPPTDPLWDAMMAVVMASHGGASSPGLGLAGQRWGVAGGRRGVRPPLHRERGRGTP
jgi:hypothetical protein